MGNMKTIGVSEETHRTLAYAKLEKDYSSFEQLIKCETDIEFED